MELSPVPTLDVSESMRVFEEGGHLFIDIRDERSYAEGHVPGAVHLHDGNVERFVQSTDKSRPVVVYCFHGINSQGGAAYFLREGFKTVYSMDGGFEAWRSLGPVERGGAPASSEESSSPGPFAKLMARLEEHPKYGPAMRDAVARNLPLILNYHTHGGPSGYCVSIAAKTTDFSPFVGPFTDDADPSKELAHIRKVGRTESECETILAAFAEALRERFGLREIPAYHLNGRPLGA